MRMVTMLTNAEEWFKDTHGDNEGPFCKEEMIAAYNAGDSEGYSRGYSEGEFPDDT
jgi:hypothetical protein